MWYINTPHTKELLSSLSKKKPRGNMGRDVLSRRTFTATSLKLLMATSGVGFFSLAELSQTQPEQDFPLTAFASEGEFLSFLKYEFPNLLFVTGEPSVDYVDHGKPDPDLLHMAYMAIALKINGLLDNPVETTGEIVENAVESTEYVIEYQQPIDETPFYQREELECNDDASSYCKKIDRPGIPMHFLSIFPFTTDDRYYFDWHQQAFCKLGNNCYLVFDSNGKATYWNGTLQSFAYEYNNKVRMGIMPCFGISRYRIPQHNNGFSKMLVQATNSLPNENMIEMVNIERNRLVV